MNEPLMISTILSALFILFWVFRRPPSPKKPKYIRTNNIDWGKIEEDILYEINEFRIENNLKPLLKDDGNYLLADLRAKDAYSWYLEHNDLTTEFHSTMHSNTRSGLLRNIGINRVGENVARGYQPKDVVQKWINSKKGHKENILTPIWKYTGVRAYYAGDCKWYYVQTFSH